MRSPMIQSMPKSMSCSLSNLSLTVRLFLAIWSAWSHCRSHGSTPYQTWNHFWLLDWNGEGVVLFDCVTNMPGPQSHTLRMHMLSDFRCKSCVAIDCPHHMLWITRLSWAMVDCMEKMDVTKIMSYRLGLSHYMHERWVVLAYGPAYYPIFSFLVGLGFFHWIWPILGFFMG